MPTPKLDIPLEKLAHEKSGNIVYVNSVAVGAALAAAGYAFNTLKQVLLEHFGDITIGEANVKAARAGYDHAQGRY